MSGTTPRAVVVAARKLASEREAEYMCVAKKRLDDFEKAHKDALKYSGELKQQHQELQRRATTARAAMDGARRHARLTAQNESYKELPLLARVVGEILRPLLILRYFSSTAKYSLIIVCGGVYAHSDLLENQAWWHPVMPFILPAVSPVLEICLLRVPHAPTQTVVDVFSRITRVYYNVRNVADMWQDMYLSAYYNRVPNPHGRTFDQAKDLMRLSVILLYITLIAWR